MFYGVTPCRGKLNLWWPAPEPDFQLPRGQRFVQAPLHPRRERAAGLCGLCPCVGSGGHLRQTCPVVPQIAPVFFAIDIPATLR